MPTLSWHHEFYNVLNCSIQSMIGLSTTPWHNTHLPHDHLQHVHASNLLSSNNGIMCVAISSHFMECYKLGKKTLWHGDDQHSLNHCDWFQNVQTITFPYINLSSMNLVVFLGNHDIVYHFENQQKTFTLLNPQPNWWILIHMKQLMIVQIYTHNKS